jgi:hypothetical protein
MYEYGMLRALRCMKEILCRKYSWQFLAKFLPASLLEVSAGYCHRALMHGSEMIIIQMGTTQHIRKWSSGLGRLVRHNPVTITVTVQLVLARRLVPSPQL